MVLQRFLAAFIRRQARLHPKLHEAMIGFGQATHRSIKPMLNAEKLNAENAVWISADAAAQLFVFSTAGGMVLYSAQIRKAIEKEKHDLATLEDQKKVLYYLKKRVESNARDLENFSKLLAAEYEHLRKYGSRFNTREGSGS